MKPFPQRPPEEPSYGRKKNNRFVTWLNKGDNILIPVFIIVLLMLIVSGAIK